MFATLLRLDCGPVVALLRLRDRASVGAWRYNVDTGPGERLKAALGADLTGKATIQEQVLAAFVASGSWVLWNLFVTCFLVGASNEGNFVLIGFVWWLATAVVAAMIGFDATQAVLASRSRKLLVATFVVVLSYIGVGLAFLGVAQLGGHADKGVREGLVTAAPVYVGAGMLGVLVGATGRSRSSRDEVAR